ncbi:hypothetical protein GGX14DRAFT_13640 [Mycena pura]|uniref:Secreted protein n=1 Tax=Mycena pura TaxID=153505 RepID=A0AAD6UWV7_9AGAR|nr:hypothetical protein GGX14DRAFT_13640 [Mycena pura]
MNVILFAAPLFAVPVARADMLEVPTPNAAVQCQPLIIEWSGGTPDYFVVILFHLSFVQCRYICPRLSILQRLAPSHLITPHSDQFPGLLLHGLSTSKLAPHSLSL